MSATHRVARLINREYVGDDWRASTYERLDGSTFQVAIGPTRLISADGHPNGIIYDETAEANMLLNLAGSVDR